MDGSRRGGSLGVAPKTLVIIKAWRVGSNKAKRGFVSLRFYGCLSPRFRSEMRECWHATLQNWRPLSAPLPAASGSGAFFAGSRR
jgi:hypothetical protein